METCVRGFSYMPENKVEVMDLQYIPSDELERTWKVSRRQRLKEQEQKIWEEFVKEQDIVNNVYKDDPYQFLHELPENCLKDLMETELHRMRKEADQEATDQLNLGEGDQPEKQAVHTVTFAEEADKTGSDVNLFHIFDDENELINYVSEDAEEECADSPSTVRERFSEAESSPTRVDNAREQPVFPVKSTENVTNLVESSIYCARVKDLRLKINEEIIAIMASLDIQNVMSIEHEEVSRKCRRSTEFCARFNRIYMYQLQRQVHDIKRNISHALPFAKHTQFQSQMLRVVSLHQNLLQAIQNFHKSFEQTSCLRESSAALRGVARLARDASALCRAAPAPRDFAAAYDLYNDELPLTCEKLDEALNEYSLRVADFLSHTEIAAFDNKSSASRKSRGKLKRRVRPLGSGSKSGSKSWSTKDTDARLSMYSLDTLRINLNAKSSMPRDNQSSNISFKTRAPLSAAAGTKTMQDKSADKTPKGHKTSPKCRRPLMRAPFSEHARPKMPKDTEIATMVEAVGTCPSSHISREMSPRSHERSPRHNTPRNSQKSTPHLMRTPSPKARVTRGSKSPSKRPVTTKIHTPPVTKMQYSRKEHVDKGGKECTKDIHDHSKEGNAKDVHSKEGSARDGHSKEVHAKDNVSSKENFSNEVPKDSENTDKDIVNWLEQRKEGNSGRQHNHIGNPGKEDNYTGNECSNSAKEVAESSTVTDFSQTMRNDDKNSERSERDRHRGGCQTESNLGHSLTQLRTKRTLTSRCCERRESCELH